MSQVISLDQADFVQPDVNYDEMAVVTSVINSIKTLNQDLSTLKKQYQSSEQPFDFTVK